MFALGVKFIRIIRFEVRITAIVRYKFSLNIVLLKCVKTNMLVLSFMKFDEGINVLVVLYSFGVFVEIL